MFTRPSVVHPGNQPLHDRSTFTDPSERSWRWPSPGLGASGLSLRVGDARSGARHGESDAPSKFGDRRISRPNQVGTMSRETISVGASQSSPVIPSEVRWQWIHRVPYRAPVVAPKRFGMTGPSRHPGPPYECTWIKPYRGW